MQGTLGDEGTSLEFRHISSYLLWYCHHCMNEELLHEVILCIGFFSVLNHDNQVGRIHIFCVLFSSSILNFYHCFQTGVSSLSKF